MIRSVRTRVDGVVVEDLETEVAEAALLGAFVQIRATAVVGHLEDEVVIHLAHGHRDVSGAGVLAHVVQRFAVVRNISTSSMPPIGPRQC